MPDTKHYEPPKVWTRDAENGGAWARINRPIAGSTHAATLPRGEHPLQLNSPGTPNGQKFSILLEELLALGEADGAGKFLQVESCQHLRRWAAQIRERPAVQRGRKVNRTWGEPSEPLHERHDASDFDLKTQDKRRPESVA